MKKNPFLILFLISNFLFAQSSIKVGEKSPKIVITDYIQNVPKNTTLENKFILLEFWATWCGPCLDGVPKLNNIQEKFKSNKDFIIISITDEKVDKVLRTLKRIPFKSLVVSDQTGKTIKNFGINAFPTTVLIDDKGFIKWIGLPESLTDDILNSFLTKKDISIDTISDKSSDVIIRNPTKIEEFSPVDLGYKTTTIKETIFSFSLFEGLETEGKGLLFDFSTEGKFQNWNEDLLSILVNLTNGFKNHIIIPEDQKGKLYSVFYKNNLFTNEKEERAKIKNLLLNLLSLKENVTYKEEPIYVLKIVNKNKLQEIFNEKGGKNGYNKTHFMIANQKIQRMLSTMSLFYNTEIKDETGLGGYYDFILRNDSIENTRKDLELYGLTLEKLKGNIPYFEYLYR